MGSSNAVVLSCVLLLIAAAPADADWSKPRTFSRSAGGMAIAANARGDLLVAWDAPAGIRVAAAERGGPFTRPQLIRGSHSDGGTEDIELAMNGRGEAVLVWSEDTLAIEDFDGPCCETVRAVTRRAGQPFGRPQTTSDASDHASYAEAAIGASGHVVVGWDACRLEAASREPGDAFPSDGSSSLSQARANATSEDRTRSRWTDGGQRV